MLSLLTEEHRQRVVRHLRLLCFTGTIYEVLSAPVSAARSFSGYVGAATKSVILGFIILATAALFVPIEIKHPSSDVGFLA